MYDVEMMQMLNLIHAENRMIFELAKSSLLSKDGQEKVTFDAYENEYKRIMKDVEKYSPCFGCDYKRQSQINTIKEFCKNKKGND